jgi:hypothetical protein
MGTRVSGPDFEFWDMWDNLSSDSMLIEASVAPACFKCTSLFAQHPVIFHLDSILHLAYALICIFLELPYVVGRCDEFLSGTSAGREHLYPVPYRVGEAGFRVVRVVRADKHTQQTMPQMAGGYLSSNRFHGKARE